MTFETVFLLETAAPLALWCEILVLLFLDATGYSRVSSSIMPDDTSQVFFFFFFFTFYWSVVDLQYCVSFRCTE